MYVIISVSSDAEMSTDGNNTTITEDNQNSFGMQYFVISVLSFSFYCIAYTSRTIVHSVALSQKEVKQYLCSWCVDPNCLANWLYISGMLQVLDNIN